MGNIKDTVLYLTEKVDAMLEPKWTRDSDGNRVNKVGYLKRAKEWPKICTTFVEWNVDYPSHLDADPSDPVYGSSTPIWFFFYFKQNGRKKPGFYLGPNHISNDIEEFIEILKAEVDKVPIIKWKGL